MVTIVATKNLADLYDLPPVDWAAVTAPLDRGVTQAPETGGPDRPHHAAVSDCVSAIEPGGAIRWRFLT